MAAEEGAVWHVRQRSCVAQDLQGGSARVGFQAKHRGPVSFLQARGQCSAARPTFRR